MPETAYLSLSSNIDPAHNLQKALDLLREICTVQAFSAIYQTPPFGYTEQPDFWDVAVKVAVEQTPTVFKAQLKAIEAQCGRDRANQISKYGPLPLDTDILLWGTTAFSYGEKPWHVPDEGIVDYAAVAIPLAEIAGAVMHPVEQVTISAIAVRFGTPKGIHKLDHHLT
jgi:2-amino-4-hydroxy-6-hydroxymethyldihydropteridine diphosphokinase